MPKMTDVASSWAMFQAPFSFIAFIPSAPSRPMPVMITPTASAPMNLAHERKRKSTLGRCRFMGASVESLHSSWPSSRFTHRCLPPGAMYAWPGRIGSLCSASFTLIWHRPFSRSANIFVKFSGMCCTITMPGQSTGMPTRNSRIASVPPVDAPTAMRRSAVFTPLGTGRFITGGIVASTEKSPSRRRGPFSRAVLAARTFSAMMSP